MNTADAWMRGYARQADADLRAYELYGRHPEALASECHKLLFLQMGCEKVGKAYLILGGADPQALQGSHAYIAKPLPQILRQQMVREGRDSRKLEGLFLKFKQIAKEIELLNPSIDRGGKRSENCEYPWEIGGQVVSPLDYQFEVSRLILLPAGVTFRKQLRQAIDIILT